MSHRWTCSCCGRSFDHLPLDFGFAAPRNWYGLPETERNARAVLTSDLCTIDGKEHYVRGCLEVPIIDFPDKLVWGVWASISEESLNYILDRWDAVITEEEAPRFGWLCTWIDGYPEPSEIRCHVYPRSNDMRPLIVLEPTDYPLAIEQHHGIRLDRVKEIAAAVGH